ncbi:MAG: SIR2 family protein, partial [Acidobacteriota bacterium]|nr:SIR2 family protein [Acidobacteriota bacterium]
MSTSEADITPDPNPPDPAVLLRQQQYQMRVRNIAQMVKRRECILFLGSAIHAPAPANSKYDYPAAKCPPIGGQLSDLLASKCGYPADQDRWNLQRVSWYYEWQSGFRSELVREIKDAVHKDREPSPILRGLARLGFPVVITTNYDQLYERAMNMVASDLAHEVGKPAEETAESEAGFDKCVYSPKSTVRTKDCSPQPSTSHPYLLKIHGDLDLPESIVITDEDYIQFVLRMGDKHPYHPVGKNVLTHLIKWPTLFIGYRLSDYNLRLLFKTLRWKMDRANIPASYAVDMKPDVLIRASLENQQIVSFIERNLW